MVHHAVMLDDNHFAMVMSDSIDPTAVSSSSTAANSRTAQQYLRIVRYMDKNFSVVSTDTENYLGNPLGAPLNPDQEPMIWSLGGGAYAFVSKSDTTAGNVQLNIRTIY